jgi:cytochrome c5
MTTALIALLMVPLLQADGAPKGDAKSGDTVWHQKYCNLCHGEEAEGAREPKCIGGRSATGSKRINLRQRPPI